MAGFIHGEINWSDPSSTLAANVRRMADAVVHYPWASTSIEESVTPQACCVMGVQRGGDGVDPDDEAERERGSLLFAADLHLYARAELAARLGLLAAEARSLNDEGLVLRAYRRWGSACADHLNGDGAFALWDASAERLICWRDLAGVRPLYYHHVPGHRLVFSSDLQSLAAHPGVPSTLDLPYTRAFLQTDHFQHPTRTFIQGVRKLPAAHILILDHNGLSLRRYWEPESVEMRADADDRESAEELRALLRQAITARLPSSGLGVGAHLSGGLDSSSIALTAASILTDRGRDLNAFSWSPPRDVLPRFEMDERDLVDAVAQHGGICAHYTRLQPSDIVEIGYRDVALRPRATLHFEVATSRRAIETGVQTILSGWGGDETIAFNGRGHFADLARRGHLAMVQRELALRSRIHGGTLRGAWKHRVLRPVLPDWALRNRSSGPSPLPPELRPDFVHLLTGVETLIHPYPRERPGVRRMQAELLRFGHLSYRMEAWAAHGAALGLTYTYPLLDRRIMEFALSLPGRMFFREGWKRWLYRTAMGEMLPEFVRWNPTKYDTAAGRHLHAVASEPAALYRERLLERQDNPLVDVNIVLAEQNRLWRLRWAPGDFSPQAPGNAAGAASWLAFTRLLPA